MATTGDAPEQPRRHDDPYQRTDRRSLVGSVTAALTKLRRDNQRLQHELSLRDQAIAALDDEREGLLAVTRDLVARNADLERKITHIMEGTTDDH